MFKERCLVQSLGEDISHLELCEHMMPYHSSQFGLLTEIMYFTVIVFIARCNPEVACHVESSSVVNSQYQTTCKSEPQVIS